MLVFLLASQTFTPRLKTSRYLSLSCARYSRLLGMLPEDFMDTFCVSGKRFFWTQWERLPRDCLPLNNFIGRWWSFVPPHEAEIASRGCRCWEEKPKLKLLSHIYIYIYIKTFIPYIYTLNHLFHVYTLKPLSYIYIVYIRLHYIYIHIYIYHHHHHVVLVARISLTLSRHFSLSFIAQAGLLDNIPYPNIVAECMFVLVVLLLLGHVWGSTRVHHLWVRPCFSSSVLHVWFV